MTSTAVEAWEDANQRRLAAEVARVRTALERRLEPDGPAPPPRILPDPVDNGSAAIDVLAAAFDLSPFERDVLLLAAAVELDGAVGALCTRVQPELAASAPTFSLALATLDDAHWSALSPDRPLRRWQLVHLPEGASVLTAPLLIDERVLHFLAGVQTTDETLRGITRRLELAPLPAPYADLAHHVARAVKQGRHVEVTGGDAGSRQAVAASVAAALDVVPLELRARDVPHGAGDRFALARVLEREAILGRALAVVHMVDQDTDHRRNAALIAAMLEAPCVVLAREPLRDYGRAVTRVALPALAVSDRLRLLNEIVGERGALDADELAAAAQQFWLDAGAVEAAAAHMAGANGVAISLWDALRAQARSSLEDLAQRIEPIATWDDLVLPAPLLETLREISLHVRRRARVYEEWGFARKTARGLGISALFAGPSGTGKTTAAEILARELRLDLYRIDLSSVVSKYIGETEKNLRRLFDAADEGGAILLFDEADALFGKRSEVKDSHDRYANIEISYLLQRMESYRGLAILTTNQRQALDPAFLRRLRFIVQFPFPDASQREQIWRRIFPDETPVDGLDAARLAQLNVAGGTIKNIALAAAFYAADREEAVGMKDVLRAARAEHAKIEKPLTDVEIAGWV